MLDENQVELIRLATGNYKHMGLVTSKEFRVLLQGKEQIQRSRYGFDLDDQTLKEYFKQIKKLNNTKHQNTLLRVWNYDCLSYSRLLHLGVVGSHQCPNCGNFDSPSHMLFECRIAQQIWALLMQKIPKPPNRSIIHYAIGINDCKSLLMVKAEILKYVMHYRELEPENVIRKAVAYLKAVNKNNFIINNL
jgi:hypothetical protein